MGDGIFEGLHRRVVLSNRQLIPWRWMGKGNYLGRRLDRRHGLSGNLPKRHNNGRLQEVNFPDQMIDTGLYFSSPRGAIRCRL